MDWLQTVFLALLQGLTEFLPISSSAHLILPAQLFGWVDQGLAFDVAVHVGTLAAVILYFRRDLTNMFRAWLCSITRGEKCQDSRLAWYVILGTLPVAAVGLLFESFIEQYLRSTLVIAVTTLVFGVGLWLAETRFKHHRTIESLRVRDVLLIGFAQALALIPGTSRSGSTMMAAMMLGMTRLAAARFSFLLSIPVILLAGSLKMLELCQTPEPVSWGHLLLGTVLAFVSAYLCIGWFLRMLEKVGLMPFVIYRLFLGIILLVFFV
ncbi:Undecaprenyl-diphosphatase [gamma proteobacterium IMCC2047]|nr:Undecaprenyl-diphosphatase [gamma proteobacterium IMCC2047]